MSLVDTDDITIEQVIACGARRGIDLVRSTATRIGARYPDNVFVQTVAQAGAYGLILDNNSANTTIGNLRVGGTGTTISDGSNPPSTTGSASVFSDADGDTVPDLCDSAPCVGVVGAGAIDTDGDGYCAAVDCDDSRNGVNPGAAETLNGIDDNCVFGPDEGFAFVDAGGDTCNDVVGVPDADGDGNCDAGDFQFDGGVLLDSSDVAAWSDGGVGSPSVVFDSNAGAFVMVFETQIQAPDGVCVNGYWGLGLAASVDGVSWIPFPGAVILPSLLEVPSDPNTDYACVAAHPTLVQNGATTVAFFKVEDETGYRGIARVLLTWNTLLGTYNVSPADPTLLLPLVQNFGYPHAVFDSTAGVYRMALSEYPAAYVTSGTASALGALVGPVLQPGDLGYGPDEVFSPAVACGPSGGYAQLAALASPESQTQDDGWNGFTGGRDYSVGANPTIVSQGSGTQSSSDFQTFVAATGALVASSTDATHLRHWDILPYGTDDYVMWYDDKGGPGGTNQIRVAHTDGGSWTAGRAKTLHDKVCTP